MWWGRQRDCSYSTFLNVGAGWQDLFSIWYPQLRNLDTEVYLPKDLVSIPLLHQAEHHIHRKWLLDWVYHSCSCEGVWHSGKPWFCSNCLKTEEVCTFSYCSLHEDGNKIDKNPLIFQHLFYGEKLFFTILGKAWALQVRTNQPKVKENIRLILCFPCCWWRTHIPAEEFRLAQLYFLSKWAFFLLVEKKTRNVNESRPKSVFKFFQDNCFNSKGWKRIWKMVWDMRYVLICLCEKCSLIDQNSLL